MNVTFVAQDDEWGTPLDLLGVPRARASTTVTLVPAEYDMVEVYDSSEARMVHVRDRMRTPGRYLVTLQYDSAEDAALAETILRAAGYSDAA